MQGLFCSSCGRTGSLKRCGACKKVSYCSPACQRAAWLLHKQVCGKTAEEVLTERGAFSSTQLTNDPSKFYVVCSSERPGAFDFCKKLEETHYTYGTPANDDFEVKERAWLLSSFWFVIVVPALDAEKVKETALQCGMLIADGIPRITHSVAGVEKKEFFPIKSGRNVWTLETAPSATAKT